MIRKIFRLILAILSLSLGYFTYAFFNDGDYASAIHHSCFSAWGAILTFFLFVVFEKKGEKKNDH